ncbi:hypothetical protein AB1Y20_023652 [Prymnesium parvum]|uniref:Uncharacterized protein n=1 Tax=Prymnesium parvum TaxID=97485 RepID=A0AB34JG15_PRYPA
MLWPGCRRRGGGEASVHGDAGNLPSGPWANEQADALSIPTWPIHTSSLVEWLVAIWLAWRCAEECSQPRWKGVPWGLLPLHTSGIVEHSSLAPQAGMTCAGNTTLSLACLRLANEYNK